MKTPINVFIGLGSNLNHPEQQVQQAINAIKTLPYCEFIASSHLYQNPPLPSETEQQADYVNAVMLIQTTLDAESLLRALQQIEDQRGRIRHADRWGPRTIDCDILLYGNQIIQTASLTIPHYDLVNRHFYLYLLAELEPQLVLPDGTALQELLLQHSNSDLHRID